MNGREIKNVVKTAVLLASRKKVPLGMEHVGTVLRVKDGSPVKNGSPVKVKGVSDLGRLVQMMLQLARMLIDFLRGVLVWLVERVHSKGTPL